MNDKKDYTEEVLPDGTIYRYYKSGKAFLRYRTKKSLDFAEEELRRSLSVIMSDIRRFKSAIKNIKTEKDQEELLLQLDSSLVRINSLLENEPLLKEYVSDIKIDGKLLRELGYSSDTIEIMRGRAKIMLETFQKELLKLKDAIMSIDFSGNEAPQIEDEINVPAGLLGLFKGSSKEANAKKFIKDCKGKTEGEIVQSYKKLIKEDKVDILRRGHIKKIHDALKEQDLIKIEYRGFCKKFY